MEADGRINFKQAQLSHSGRKKKEHDTLGFFCPYMRINAKSLNALIQNQDFTIDVLGKIKFLKHD